MNRGLPESTETTMHQGFTEEIQIHERSLFIQRGMIDSISKEEDPILETYERQEAVAVQHDTPAWAQITTQCRIAILIPVPTTDLESAGATIKLSVRPSMKKREIETMTTILETGPTKKSDLLLQADILQMMAAHGPLMLDKALTYEVWTLIAEVLTLIAELCPRVEDLMDQQTMMKSAWHRQLIMTSDGGAAELTNLGTMVSMRIGNLGADQEV
jgi:hypothetical protein